HELFDARRADAALQESDDLLFAERRSRRHICRGSSWCAGRIGRGGARWRRGIGRRAIVPAHFFNQFWARSGLLEFGFDVGGHLKVYTTAFYRLDDFLRRKRVELDDLQKTLFVIRSLRL